MASKRVASRFAGSLDSAVESTVSLLCGGKPLISSQDLVPSSSTGFRVDSPVKKPVASELPGCAPPYTFRTGEEPCRGGRPCRPVVDCCVDTPNVAPSRIDHHAFNLSASRTACPCRDVFHLVLVAASLDCGNVDGWTVGGVSMDKPAGPSKSGGGVAETKSSIWQPVRPALENFAVKTREKVHKPYNFRFVSQAQAVPAAKALVAFEGLGSASWQRPLSDADVRAAIYDQSFSAQKLNSDIPSFSHSSVFVPQTPCGGHRCDGSCGASCGGCNWRQYPAKAAANGVTSNNPAIGRTGSSCTDGHVQCPDVSGRALPPLSQ